eukprot:scaffold1690_cov182-Amphora_coffeaeformis.AAC.16
MAANSRRLARSEKQPSIAVQGKKRQKTKWRLGKGMRASSTQKKYTTRNWRFVLYRRIAMRVFENFVPILTHKKVVAARVTVTTTRAPTVIILSLFLVSSSRHHHPPSLLPYHPSHNTSIRPVGYGTASVTFPLHNRHDQVLLR